MGALISDIRHLEITDDGEDVGGHVIIPNGPLDFFFSPYDETARFFRRQHFNFAVFSYDWRRSLDEASELLERFLVILAEEVSSRIGPGHDPRPRTTVVCHSLGGLVGLLLLQRLKDRVGGSPEAIAEWLHCIVTVGTPFYGTGSALHSYYTGLPYFNEWYGADVVTRVISSFPGPPVAHFLDRRSYREYLLAFAERDELPELDRYPGRVHGGLDAGECDLFAAETQLRYPPWKRRSHLEGALGLRQWMHRRLPEEFMSRLFHIRVPGYETCSEIQWREVDGSTYRLGMAAPFERRMGSGDGVVPIWSARYCYTPSTQVWDIEARTDHTFLMEDAAILAGVQHVAVERSVPREVLERRVRSRQRQVATRQHAHELFARARTGAIKKTDAVLRRHSLWRRFFHDIVLG